MNDHRQFVRLAGGVLAAAVALAALAGPDLVLAADPAASAEHNAALKETVKRDQAALKSYEWIETVALNMNGEEKSKVQNRCYYGADGVLQKVPVGDQAEAKGKRGIRGKVAAEKKGEIATYLTKSAEAIKKYVPPDPVRIQAAKDAGKASVEVLEPGKRVRLNFKDYLVPNDLLGVEIDLTTNHLRGLNVTTFLEGEKDPVNLKVGFAALDDGTGYAKTTVLTAEKVGVTVNTENSGYRKAATPKDRVITGRRVVRMPQKADPILTLLKKICLGLPDTKLTMTWGKPHFRVGEKIFCGYGEEDGRSTIGFKLGMEHSAARVARDARFTRAPYVGHRGWVSMDATRVKSWNEVRDLVLESYRLIAPRRSVAKLEPEGRATALPRGGERPA